jgi:putative copper resistance protein D
LIWLLRDFDLLAVLLHAASLSLEALLLGGIAFLLVAARPAVLSKESFGACCRLMRWSAFALAVIEAVTISVNSASMMAGSSMGWRDLLSASFLHAEALTILLALILGLLVRFLNRDSRRLMEISIVIPGMAMLGSIVYLSHATSQMNHRLLLAVFTALHHLGTVAWLGAMPYLILTVRNDDDPGRIARVTRRYSSMALISVVVLVAAGIGMAWFYVGSPAGLYGTSYGLMLLAKIYLLGLMLTLGAGN